MDLGGLFSANYNYCSCNKALSLLSIKRSLFFFLHPKSRLPAYMWQKRKMQAVVNVTTAKLDRWQVCGRELPTPTALTLEVTCKTGVFQETYWSSIQTASLCFCWIPYSAAAGVRELMSRFV